MREQHAERLWRQATAGFSQVAARRERRPTVVFHAHDGDAVAAAPHQSVLVEQQVPSHLALCLLQAAYVGQAVGRRGVAIVLGVVVIAHDGHHAVRSVQAAQYGAKSIHFLGAVVDQVACKDNQVGVECIDPLHDFAHHLLVATQCAEVQVRQLHDAIAVEALRQAGAAIGKLLHGQFAIARRKSVEHRTKGGAAHAGGHPSQGIFPPSPAALQATAYAEQQESQCLGHYQAQRTADKQSLPMVGRGGVALVDGERHECHPQHHVGQGATGAQPFRAAFAQAPPVYKPYRQQEQQGEQKQDAQ